jgi:hypothetical protein
VTHPSTIGVGITLAVSARVHAGISSKTCLRLLADAAGRQCNGEESRQGHHRTSRILPAASIGGRGSLPVGGFPAVGCRGGMGQQKSPSKDFRIARTEMLIPPG